METTIIYGLVQLGGMAILAAMVFYFYRIDRNDAINKLAEIAKAEIECRDKESDSRQQLAAALNNIAVGMASLKTLIETRGRG
ncbi:MAG: hypothetical protein PHU08_00015 [Dehalococcoidales bacterium]|nr:hypothetical protein [Dehalococcoidales bacterium]